jgi:hypothetical protein
MLGAVVACEAGGVAGLRTISHQALYASLGNISRCREEPGCESKIRAAAQALAFCMEHSLDNWEGSGQTTGGAAATLCCGVFGRDEGDSEFTFKQRHIDTLLCKWTMIVRAQAPWKSLKPSADNIFVLELCISDANKPLLMANHDFIPYLLDALLLDPDHPRSGLQEDLRVWLQSYHAQCFAQLATHEPSRHLLKEDPTVTAALQAVSEGGLSMEAQEHASAALLALSDKELQVITEGQKHVMLSCECA